MFLFVIYFTLVGRLSDHIWTRNKHSKEATQSLSSESERVQIFINTSEDESETSLSTGNGDSTLSNTCKCEPENTYLTGSYLEPEMVRVLQNRKSRPLLYLKIGIWPWFFKFLIKNTKKWLIAAHCIKSFSFITKHRNQL